MCAHYPRQALGAALSGIRLCRAVEASPVVVGAVEGGIGESAVANRQPVCRKDTARDADTFKLQEKTATYA